jgi:hypothetical protein
MAPLTWLDVPLLLVGVPGAALSASAWLRKRPRRPGVAAAAFVLSLGCLAAAGADAGLSRWDNVRLPFDPAALDFSQNPYALLPAGSPAPDFALPRADGMGTVRLSDFRGRQPVVLVLSSFG